MPQGDHRVDAYRAPHRNLAREQQHEPPPHYSQRKFRASSVLPLPT
jgi:hypothetical protein